MPESGQLVQKSAVRFAKLGGAVYHSHHDLIRFWERAVRRAGLPLRLSQGFNPRPRLVFPHALGLGIASRVEEVEIELRARVGLRELRERLAAACAGGLEVLEVVNLPPARKSRRITASSYRISGWNPAAAAALARAAAEILSRSELSVERGAPGERRRVDIRPFIKRLSVAESGEYVELDIIHAQAGSARPDEAAGLLASALGVDRRDLKIEKTGMRLE